MQSGKGGTVFDPVQPERRDTELTLGPFLLTLIGSGLFGLCGLCFLFGYAVGHRNAESSSAISVPSATTPAFSAQAVSQSKPSAGQGNPVPEGAVVPPDPSESDNSNPAGHSSETPTPAAAAEPVADSSTSGSEPAVHTVVNQPVALPSSGGGAEPAMSQAGGVMVQIAAVSHSEDADVLVGALRKRGYAVAARRDPGDGLLHVQIGPFASRNDAYAMRQKLLNDGYNAIVQP